MSLVTDTVRTSLIPSQGSVEASQVCVYSSLVESHRIRADFVRFQDQDLRLGLKEGSGG